MKLVHSKPKAHYKLYRHCFMLLLDGCHILLWSSTGVPSSSSSPNMTLAVPSSTAKMASIVRVSTMYLQLYAVTKLFGAHQRKGVHLHPRTELSLMPLCIVLLRCTDMWRSSLDRLECSGEQPFCCSARKRCQRRRGRRSFLVP